MDNHNYFTIIINTKYFFPSVNISFLFYGYTQKGVLANAISLFSIGSRKQKFTVSHPHSSSSRIMRHPIIRV